jgi:hypothetical protein
LKTWSSPGNRFLADSICHAIPRLDMDCPSSD